MRDPAQTAAHPTMPTVPYLVGRDPELDRIQRLLTDTRRGRAGTIVFSAIAGGGKSVLVRAAGDRCATAGFRVVEATGIEGEGSLPLAGLVSLVQPLRQYLPAVGPGARSVLTALLGDGQALTPDRFALGVALLELLATAATDEPLAVLVDDAHWLDRLSLETLVFALRRLAADRVAAILAIRTDQVAELLPASACIELPGLSAAAVRQLLAASAGQPVSAAVATQVTAATGGNPLAVVDIAGALSAEQLAGAAPLPSLLPYSGRALEPYRSRLAGLPARTRRSLTVWAAAGSAPVAFAASAMARLGLRPRDLDAAEVDGVLIRAADGHRIFAHPLLRSAALVAASPADRRRVHAELAAVFQDHDLDRHAAHLAAAAEAPDERVAAVLERSAQLAVRRGGPSAAADVLLKAAELSEPGVSRQSRLLSAGESLFLAGRRSAATTLFGEVLSDGTPELRAEAALALGRARLWDEPIAATAARTDDILRVASVDAEHSVQALLIQAVLERNALHLEDFRTIAERAWDLRAAVAPSTALAVHSLLAEALLATRRESDPRVVTFVEAMKSALADPALDLSRLVNSPTETLEWAGEHQLARTLAERWGAFARIHAPTLVPYHYCTIVSLDAWAGRPDSGIALGTECLALAEQTGSTTVATWLHALLCGLYAIRGDVEKLGFHAATALARSISLEQPSIPLWINYAMGLSALGQGDAVEAVASFERVAHTARPAGVRNPRVVPWLPDLAVALAAVGRRSDALRTVEELEGLTDGRDDPWLSALASRTRGTVIDDAHSLDLLEQAASGSLKTTPFEHGRALLTYGLRLRRRRNISLARSVLSEATTVLASCGPWLEQALREARAAGAAVIPPAHDLSSLTPQELQVALAVADGQSNRQVAQTLFLSVKTVEHHLSRVYVKLGVKNRVALARLIPPDGDAGPEQAAPGQAGDRAR